MKRIIFSLCISCITTISVAQKETWSLFVNQGLATNSVVDNTEDLHRAIRHKPTLIFGGGLSYMPARDSSVRPVLRLVYQQKGHKQVDGTVVSPITIHRNIFHYLSFQGGWNFILSHQQPRFYLSTSIGVELLLKTKFENPNIDPTSNLTLGHNDFRKIYPAAQFGLGAQFSNRFYFEANSSIDIFPSSRIPEVSVLNRLFMIALGYNFPSSYQN